MGRYDPSEPGDDFKAEVSDVGPRAGSAPGAPARSPLEPRLTPHRRVIRLVGTGLAGLLALALVLGSIPSVRGQVRALLTSPGPIPMPTAPPAQGFFYLLPNPPGVTVSVDGRALAALPYPGNIHPLYLTRGHHTFSWRSRLFPFPPLQCTLSVPFATRDTCELVSPETLNQEHAIPRAPIIATHLSLAALVPTQLKAAIQQALDDHRSSALVPSGEYYFSCQPQPSCAPVTTRQPLRATLSYRSISEPGYPEPCFLGQGIPCRAAGQDCTQLCTIPIAPLAVTGADAARTWVTVAMVHATWDYATLDGEAVASEGESFGAQLAVLRITWDQQGWHVTLVFGHTPNFDVADDAVCDPARYWLGQSGTWAFMVADAHPGTAQFVSDTTPTDGCLVVLDPHPGSDVPAVFLERFGVLLAVNDVAYTSADRLPIANAAEQRMAQQLLAQLQP